STYSVRASLTGFGPAEAMGMELVVGQTMNLDFTIKPANVNQTVTILADVVEARVDTNSASMGANVDTREVAALPVNGRQISQLYLQAPGASNTGTGTFNEIRFNGRAVDQNEVRYDGIEGTGIIDASPGVPGGELATPFRLQSSLENVQEFR